MIDALTWRWSFPLDSGIEVDPPYSSHQLTCILSCVPRRLTLLYLTLLPVDTTRHPHSHPPHTHLLTSSPYLTCYPYHPHLYQLTTSYQLLLVTAISYHTSIRGETLANFCFSLPQLVYTEWCLVIIGTRLCRYQSSCTVIITPLVSLILMGLI